MIFTTPIRSSGRRSEQDFINKRIETIERHGSHFLWKTSRWGKNNGDKLIIDRTQDCVKFSLEVRPTIGRRFHLSTTRAISLPLRHAGEHFIGRASIEERWKGS